jgi:hypothetical protein
LVGRFGVKGGRLAMQLLGESLKVAFDFQSSTGCMAYLIGLNRLGQVRHQDQLAVLCDAGHKSAASLTSLNPAGRCDRLVEKKNSQESAD